MKRLVEISGWIRCTELADDLWGIEVLLRECDVVPLCLNLMLLLYEHAEVVVAKQQSASEQLRLALCKGVDRSSIVLDAGKRTILLSENDAQVAIGYLLQYYRDGFAPVPHIDIDLTAPEGVTSEYSLTIWTDQYASPMSSEDARRLLGDDSGS